MADSVKLKILIIDSLILNLLNSVELTFNIF
jgi:hypothetical protein